MTITEELYTRNAALEPATFNADRNSVQVIFSTGAGVLRRDFEGEFLEVLDMGAASVDLSQLRGAPVLDSHNRLSGVAAVLGVVDEAAVDGARGLATIRLSQRPELAGFRRDVQDGIIRSVSAGYTVEKWATVKGADGVRVKTGTRWTPKEISFTALGADPGARTRSKEDFTMDMQTQYRSIAQAVGVPMEFADGLATRNLPVDEARSSIVREAARLLPPVENRAPAIVSRDAADGLISRMADGLQSRINSRHVPTEGREFANFTMADFARRCLEADGRGTLGTRSELITRAMHTTSDFSLILGQLYNKELLALRTNPSPLLQFWKRATADDFRARQLLEISDGSGLLEVGEAGEVKHGTITEKELSSYRVKSFARGFNISFQALVNDDMGALSDLSMKLTRGARQWFAGLLVDTIVANPILADGVAVFHASHGNLAASGAVPGEVTIGAGKLAMRVQTDLSGNVVDATPQFLLIPAALEATVDKLLATLYPTQPSEAAVAARSLTPIVDPRLDAAGQSTAWYLFADPAIAPVFEYSELSGHEGPQVETRQAFPNLGTEIRVVWHVGAGAIDSRGGYKNAGV